MTLPCHANFSHGNPAKDVRRFNISRTAAPDPWQDAVELPAVRVQSFAQQRDEEKTIELTAIEVQPLEPAKEVVVVPPETAAFISQPVQETVPEPQPIRRTTTAVTLEPEPATVVFRGRSGYLSDSGSVPLRFGAANAWPAPLPEDVRASIAGTRSQPKEAEAAEAEVRRESVQAVAEQVMASLREEDANRVTAEMIISFFDKMEPGMGARRVAFEPAIHSETERRLAVSPGPPATR